MVSYRRAIANVTRSSATGFRTEVVRLFSLCDEKRDVKRLKCFQRPWEHQFARRDSTTPLRLRWCHISPRNRTKSLTCAQSRFLAFSILANCVVPLAPATSRMSTIAFDLFFVVSSALEAIRYSTSSFHRTLVLSLEME